VVVVDYTSLSGTKAKRGAGICNLFGEGLPTGTGSRSPSGSESGGTALLPSELLLRYVMRGMLTEADTVTASSRLGDRTLIGASPEKAERLQEDKVADPIATAVGDYALLRIGLAARPQRLHASGSRLPRPRHQQEGGHRAFLLAA
jgi:hypothetical protein